MTGRWFPDYRTATPEQTREYREAHQALFRNGRYEQELRTAYAQARAHVAQLIQEHGKEAVFEWLQRGLPSDQAER